MRQKALRDSWTQYAEDRGLVKAVAVLEEPTRSKYGNVKTEVGGRIFDSKKEAAFYQTLKLREMAGEVDQIECQPVFYLHVMQLWRPDEIQITTVGRFTADFRFRELLKPRTGEIRVVDVKSEGTRTNVAYRLRVKIAEAVHGITVEEGLED